MPPFITDRKKKLTGYAQELRSQGRYPLKPSIAWRERKPNRERPVATAFLVIPAYAGDPGTARPLSPAQAHFSPAIEFTDTSTHAVAATPLAGHTYAIACTVTNRGAVGSFAGIAEFYVASAAVLDAWANGSGPRPAPLGYGGFMVTAGGQAKVTCQRHWTVAGADTSVLVCVYDPLVDKPAIQHDSALDRHVARRDLVPDFSGTYQGTEHFADGTGNYQLKIVIQQTGNVANIAIYSQVGGGLPAAPQLAGSAAVTGASFVFNCGEQIGGQPFTSNVMTFSLTNPNLLHYTMHRHFMQPGDTRPDQDLVADLPRV